MDDRLVPLNGEGSTRVPGSPAPQAADAPAPATMPVNTDASVSLADSVVASNAVDNACDSLRLCPMALLPCWCPGFGATWCWDDDSCGVVCLACRCGNFCECYLCGCIQNSDSECECARPFALRVGRLGPGCRLHGLHQLGLDCETDNLLLWSVKYAASNPATPPDWEDPEGVRCWPLCCLGHPCARHSNTGVAHSEQYPHVFRPTAFDHSATPEYVPPLSEGRRSPLLPPPTGPPTPPALMSMQREDGAPNGADQTPVDRNRLCSSFSGSFGAPTDDGRPKSDSLASSVDIQST
mmetsp:Transcript_73163/g.162480  ORF Transcript_73163/g.162480 Transcript_73163/m.162480 type:complete len:295 (-) Transcript_73163:72-956(-)